MRNQRQYSPRPFRSDVTSALLLALITVLVSGCILKPQVGVTLITTPEALLDFGAVKSQLTLTVNKNFSETVMGPLVIKSSADWITVGNCTDPSNECFTNGPANSLKIPILVDRNRLVLGANRAQLILNAQGASQKIIDVFVEDLLQVQFDVSKRKAKVNETLQFTDKTLVNNGSAITQWGWDFGDGATSSSKNPLHKYSGPGVYDVSLTVSTGNGAETLTMVSLVTVTAGSPTVDFTGSPKILLAGEQVRFTQLISSPDVAVTSQQWNFGDGGSSAEANPTYTYNVAGVYSVSLTANTNFGSTTETKNQYIIVNPKQAPIARFSVSTLNGFVNIPIQFTDISTPGSAPIDTWAWDFGDDTSSSQQSPGHSFATVGTFTVTLTVTTAHGSSSISQNVTVDFKPPSADFMTLGPLTNPAVGESVQFQDLSTDGSVPVNSWKWTFGDGTTSTQQNPIKTYNKPGTFTVSLEVKQPTATNNADTETKTNYISVFVPPVPKFNVSTESVYVGNSVTFTNKTVPGTGASLTHEWDFNGDNIVDSTAVSKHHTYTQSGTFVVTLTNTVTRPVSGGTFSVSTMKTVVADDPPFVDFSADQTTIKADDPVSFTDESTPGTSPITIWEWNFGDGEASNAQNPNHAYSTEGAYTVSLTITVLHSLTGEPFSVTETKTDYIDVTPPLPPTAGFIANPTVITIGQNAVFANQSVQGTGSNLTFLWDFGDGSAASTQTNPAHQYSAIGDYTVTLTVTTSDGTDSLTRQDYITVRNTTDPLEDYVMLDDGVFDYEVIEEGTFIVEPSTLNEPIKIYIVKMTSQKWRDISEYFVTATNTDIWEHYMVVLCPQEVKSNKTLLFITGGSNGGNPPTIDDPESDPLLQGLGLLAAGTDTVVTVLQQVPNESLSFRDEFINGSPPLRTRTEDGIIAFTFDKFLKGESAKSDHETWPLLLPMVKSAVRAMDTVQAMYNTPKPGDTPLTPCESCTGGAANRNPVRDFFVTGGSKRGWTTWLTGAVDSRVTAIAPLVIDVLNMDRQMEHHFNAYGYWAPSIYDYAQEQVFDRFLDPVAESLLDIVDPFKRRADVAGIPKYLINSSGDQFFLPDSAQWYYDQLPGEKYINYVPNTSHGLGLSDGLDLENPDTAAAALFSFYAGFVSNITTPTFTYTNNPDGTISVSSTRPFKRVTQWSAHNPNARDFREERIGKAYTSKILSIGPGGAYTTTIKNDDVTQGWTAVYIQVQFENTSPIFDQFNVDVPFVFSTPVRVLPENPDGTNLYPEFNGFRDTVPGTGFTVPVTVVQGSASEMGMQYGELMSTEINALLPNMLAAAQAANPLLTNANLDAAYAAVFANADVRIIEELEGIAIGSGLDLLTVQRANMVALLDQMTGTAVASTRSQVLGGVDGKHSTSSTTLDWTLDYGLQDYPVVVVYIPSFGNGVPHANVTFAGLVGSFAGINLGGITTGAVIDPDQPGDPAFNLLTGHHVTTLNREILYGALNYDDIYAIVNDQLGNLFRRQHLVASDGGNWRSSLKAVSNPGDDTNIWNDNDVPEEFQALADTSYSASQGTGFETTIFTILNNNSGSITQALLNSMNSQITGNGNNLLNVQFDVNAGGGSISLWVSYAQGTTEAKQFAPAKINLTDYLP